MQYSSKTFIDFIPESAKKNLNVENSINKNINNYLVPKNNNVNEKKVAENENIKKIILMKKN